MSFSLQDLNARIIERSSAGPEQSYTAQLLSQGIEKCARKLGEEALETVIAAIGNNRLETKNEAADLLYHLLVVLRASGVELDEVMDELERRTAQSGIAEKAGR
ncbi:Phosphoribosyl-ATP pyrophosphatase [hydrothermal vent metagenome]|uniref:phosphoribosyl-ATP diphosphatase n=1 Tax=hydrothermal vent metagenome TaxID=652676 RepID=A0A3B0TWW0_9ZZZZ